MAERPAKPEWVAGWHPQDQNMNNNAIWDAVEFIFPDYPVLTTDLEAEASFEESAEASFTIACESPARGSLSYQWQKMATGATSFSDIGSATSATYTIASWDSSTDEGSYRCKIVNTYNSNTATVYSTACVATTAE